jgi:transposase
MRASTTPIRLRGSDSSAMPDSRAVIMAGREVDLLGQLLGLGRDLAGRAALRVGADGEGAFAVAVLDLARAPLPMVTVPIWSNGTMRLVPVTSMGRRSISAELTRSLVCRRMGTSRVSPVGSIQPRASTPAKATRSACAASLTEMPIWLARPPPASPSRQRRTPCVTVLPPISSRPAEDEASLEAQLLALQGAAEPSAPPATAPRARPRRQPLPEHLRRVEHHHGPENTTCPTPECGRAMVRIGEDVSERLDIVPAEFFVHRHIRGKWACRCCQVLVQEPVEPQIIDKGMPRAGLLAHTLVSRFVDHLPYYLQEQINARAGVHTPRSTLAAWSGAAGPSLQPLYDAHRDFVLGAQVLHADETPVRMLDPRGHAEAPSGPSGKTTKAYVWAYARG